MKDAWIRAAELIEHLGETDEARQSLIRIVHAAADDLDDRNRDEPTDRSDDAEITSSSYNAMRPRPAAELDAIQIRVLRWFDEFMQSGAGYEVRGARGWAQQSEVATALDRRLGDELTRLAARGLLDRENVALPGRPQKLWLHRLSAPGATAIHVELPPQLGPPEPPSLRTILTDCQWAVLEFMRRAKTEPTPTRFATRELGWRTVGEITNGASIRSKDIQVWAEDVHHLGRIGLLEKRTDKGVARVRELTFYRVTEDGEYVTRIDRHSRSALAGG